MSSAVASEDANTSDGMNAINEGRNRSERPSGNTRMLDKINACMSSGNFYEAHQLYRTLYFRYFNKNKYGDVQDLLFNGAMKLFQHGQMESGVDLAEVLVSFWKQISRRPTDELFNLAANLFEKMSPSCSGRDRYLREVIQWSGLNTGTIDYSTGHPNLNKLIAEIYWNQADYASARRHYLYSGDGIAFAEKLVNLHMTHGFSYEIDLFIAQVVFQFLCLRQTTCAAEAFKCYTNKHPGIENGPYFMLPLLNFIKFLLETLKQRPPRKMASFVFLCNKYRVCLTRDPSYVDYIERIGKIYFSISARMNAFPGNLTNNMLQSIMRNFVPDDSDSSSGNDLIEFSCMSGPSSSHQ